MSTPSCTADLLPPTPLPSPTAAARTLADALADAPADAPVPASQKRRGADTRPSTPPPPLKRRRAIFGRRARAEMKFARATAEVHRQPHLAAYLARLKAQWKQKVLTEVMACLLHFGTGEADQWDTQEILRDLEQKGEEECGSDDEEENGSFAHPLAALFYFVDQDFDWSGDGWLEGRESWGYVIARLEAVPQEVPALKKAIRDLALGNIFS